MCREDRGGLDRGGGRRRSPAGTSWRDRTDQREWPAQPRPGLRPAERGRVNSVVTRSTAAPGNGWGANLNPAQSRRSSTVSPPQGAGSVPSGEEPSSSGRGLGSRGRGFPPRGGTWSTVRAGPSSPGVRPASPWGQGMSLRGRGIPHQGWGLALHPSLYPRPPCRLGAPPSASPWPSDL